MAKIFGMALEILDMVDIDLYQVNGNQWLKKLIKKYKLNNNSKILDVGCGKSFLLHEIKLILPRIKIIGYEISKYAMRNSTKLIKPYLKFKYAEKNIHLKTIILI